MPLVDDEAMEVLLEIRDALAEQLAALREMAAHLDRQARAGEAFAAIARGEEQMGEFADSRHAAAAMSSRRRDPEGS